MERVFYQRGVHAQGLYSDHRRYTEAGDPDISAHAATTTKKALPLSKTEHQWHNGCEFTTTV